MTEHIRTNPDGSVTVSTEFEAAVRAVMAPMLERALVRVMGSYVDQVNRGLSAVADLATAPPEVHLTIAPGAVAVTNEVTVEPADVVLPARELVTVVERDKRGLIAKTTATEQDVK